MMMQQRPGAGMAKGRRALSAPGETAKLEKETREKMRKLAEIRSAVAAERQITEELRREVSTKGWWSGSTKGHQESPHEKGTKSTKLLQQVPPPSFKIKRSATSSPGSKIPDSFTNENKHAKTATLVHSQSLKTYAEFDEVESQASFAEALTEWRNPRTGVKPEGQSRAKIPLSQPGPEHRHPPTFDSDLQNRIKVPPFEAESDFRPLSTFDSGVESGENLEPMMIDSRPPSRSCCAMGMQTEKPKVVETDDEVLPTVKGTYFQHLCMQDYRKCLPQ